MTWRFGDGSYRISFCNRSNADVACQWLSDDGQLHFSHQTRSAAAAGDGRHQMSRSIFGVVLPTIESLLNRSLSNANEDPSNR